MYDKAPDTLKKELWIYKTNKPSKVILKNLYCVDKAYVHFENPSKLYCKKNNGEGQTKFCSVT